MRDAAGMPSVRGMPATTSADGRLNMLLYEGQHFKQSAQNGRLGVVLRATLSAFDRRVGRNPAPLPAILARILPAFDSRLAVFGRRTMPFDSRKTA
jgi:hypothetical protein